MSDTQNAASGISPFSSALHARRLLCAIVVFAALAPGILMTAPAVAAQLASEWQLSPARIGYLFSTELGGMSLATVPAWWWMRRISWRKVALGAVGVFLLANLLSAAVTRYEPLLLVRFAASLAGGTLMILCISCAAATANPSRTYAFWVLGQLLLGIAGLLALPPLFAVVGLKAAYLGLAAIAALALPLVGAFPARFKAAECGAAGRRVSLARRLQAVLAVLLFYISLSAIWTFIGGIGHDAGLTPVRSGQVLAAATLFGIIGAGAAALRGTGRRDSVPVLLGYTLLALSIILLADSPQLGRFALAALLFKFTWTFVLPFILARVARLDRDGRLMNSINLVIGGGMALGPAIAGALLQHFPGTTALLAGAGLCAIASFILIAAASAGRQ
ncbi:MFS transporter [Pluralibacter gergoviae]|uniref:MFS transporter n=1 Tax=Pluralibacter gergoviae TaxID=61647 RepID=UPI000651B860|nr:MFS transporter [Pluralibacter gergoviae]EKV6247158.1 MFS transporter [Pluralibacter gergoviae]EKW9964822.1 MFS transporter [Pluralibacter gergoviae]ELD4299463.1 MFS transporter [Pluralibacter gergoviae]ELN2737951.1 MFS transporter [Pluralibacter gergoviae]KMK33731.1 MFS transporter [Pluralibacter gergoviae]